MLNTFILTWVFTLFLVSLPAFPCTSFLNSGAGRNVMAKNFDWDQGQGMVVVNKRNVRKIALANETNDVPLLWTSKYGSVTFNQVGRELPFGGMNEKGLAIEVLWLDETEYPDLIPGIQMVNVPQWVQTMLDRASTIDEMVALTKEFQVHSTIGKTHYFACDATGECAVFEYLQKSLFISRMNSKKDIRVVTNDPYNVSAARLKEYEGFGGHRAIPTDSNSLSRFIRTAMALQDDESSNPLVDRTFKVLEKSQSLRTQWSIVYDPAMEKIYFKTKKQPALKTISLNTMDMNCHTAVKVLDINTRLRADVSSQFEDYSDAFERDIVEQNSLVPEKSWKKIESVPATDACI